MNKLVQNNINALLLTIIIHLVVLFFFFATRINNMYTERNMFEINLSEPETKIVQTEAPKPSQADLVNKMADAFIAGQTQHNIAVNAADNNKSAISAEKYLQQVKAEMDAAQSHLGDIEKSYKEADKDMMASRNDEKTDIHSNTPPPQTTTKGVYKGPTTINFDLKGRKIIHYPIPVYKCQGRGKVVIHISVNQRGEVTDAIVDKALSVNEECLFEAACKDAKNTRFNADYQNAPSSQKGTISYMFVAQ